jgi:hypothetical protein
MENSGDCSLLSVSLPSLPLFDSLTLNLLTQEKKKWFGRENFQEAVKLAARVPEHNIDWKKLVFKVFDAPTHPGIYQHRFEFLGLFLFSFLFLFLFILSFIMYCGTHSPFPKKKKKCRKSIERELWKFCGSGKERSV